ncbi:MAG TPA: recombinase RecA, partial [Gemmataceae bacterium]|nr:recombinase RecA [Gemmataceae bacterium]
EGDLLDLAIEDKVIDKSGAWINYGELRLGQGRENAKQYLRENPALVDELARKVLEKRGLLQTPQPAAETNGEAAPPAKPEPVKKDRESKRQAAAVE